MNQMVTQTANMQYELINLNVHHIGYAIADIDAVKAAYAGLGAAFFHESIDEERNLSFYFASIGENIFEFVSPLDKEKKCAVTNLIKTNACAPYHICFLTENLTEEIHRLKKYKFKQIGKIIESDLYGYSTIGCFLYSISSGLIELVQKL